jgi:hypothetical protein
MKKHIFGLALLAASATTWANDPGSCENTGIIAAKIMEARQVGIPISKLLQAVEGKAAEAMVHQAFDVSRFQTEEYQQKAIRDFREKWEVTCYKVERASTRRSK